MKEFKRRALEFKYDGEPHRLKYPSVEEVEWYQKKTIDGGVDTDMTDTYKFLEKLGLEKKHAKTFEVEHLAEIVEILLGVKKK